MAKIIIDKIDVKVEYIVSEEEAKVVSDFIIDRAIKRKKNKMLKDNG